MTTIRADVRFLATDEGGRRTPVATGYRPQFYFENQDYDCTATFSDDPWVRPGDYAFTLLRLSEFASGMLYCKIAPGCTFALREGGRTVATGKVTGVLDGDPPH